jgi:shikimate kinase
VRVFIIGPGGVDKTTSGKILAQKLNYDFIDLDIKFCEQIETVGTFIRNYGYPKYCHQNSKLFFKLLDENVKDVVMPLSSGFLIHEDQDNLVEKHNNAIKKNGISILLLPSKSLVVSEKIVVERQLKRGFGLKRNREQEKIRSRFPKYKVLGDIKIFSHSPPKIIATLMHRSLKEFLK